MVFEKRILSKHSEKSVRPDEKNHAKEDDRERGSYKKLSSRGKRKRSRRS
jgi:hypothetical protein